jgi:hypothetical protein
MALNKTIEKLNKYLGRLEAGKAKKIKPAHVDKVIKKLTRREQDLLEELEGTSKDSKKARLEARLKTTREQIERATWLRDQIN